MEINHNNISTPHELRQLFSSPPAEYRPVPAWLLDGDISDEEKIASQLGALKKAGFGGAAIHPMPETLPECGSEEYLASYGRILECCRELGLKVIYCDDMDQCTGHACGEFAEKYPDEVTEELVMREYTCTAGEAVSRKLDTDGVTLALTAYEVDTRQVIDIREYFKDGTVNWEPPHGNWDIIQFICRPAEGAKYVNMLNYDACLHFIELTYERFAGQFEEYIGSVVGMTFYDDIQFIAPNRRSWDSSFNTVFMETYGFDCAPYYLALFRDIGEEGRHVRTMMFDCRADMLCRGYIKAVSDFTRSRGLVSSGHVAEPKTTLASWMFGDGMLYQKYAGAAGVEMSHDYLYGINGCKLASGAANNYDKSIVACEIYGEYPELDADILYREAMNVFARGINFIIPHSVSLSGGRDKPFDLSETGGLGSVMPDFNRFAARCQAMLRGGRHVCDIAVLYPIYSLHSQSYLYSSASQGFEFPQVPDRVDYTNVINSLMNYSCLDLTLLHPKTVTKQCHVEDGCLCLANDVNHERFKVIILPFVEIVSLKNMRMLAKFFDEGGRIIATGTLPDRAFEYMPPADSMSMQESTADEEVRMLSDHIFGVSGEETNYWMEHHYTNTNDNGGIAIFVPVNETAVDGSSMVRSADLDELLGELNMGFDIEFDNPPRVANSGLLNMTRDEFRSLRAGKFGIKSGGLFNHIHRRYAGCSIFFISNSTNHDYEGRVSVRGSFHVEEWNPYTGEIRHITSETGEYKGEIYTFVEIELAAARSTFLVCTEREADIL